MYYQKSKDYNPLEVRSMNVRKNRIPLQGVTNFLKTQAEWNTKPKNVWTPIQECIKKTKQYSQRPETKQLKMQISHKKQKTTQGSPADKASNGLTLIRKTYKNRSNVWRIAKAWNFSNRGFITEQQFREKIVQVVSGQITQQQVDKIVTRYGNGEGKIDLNGFFKVIYGQQQEFTYKPRLYELTDENRLRELKIENLVDKLDAYKPAMVKKSKNHHSVKEMTAKCHQKRVISQIEQKDLGTEAQFSKQEFFRVSHEGFSKFRQALKNQHMHPQSMLSQNQIKTRFGATISNFRTQNILGSGSNVFPQKSSSTQNLKNLAPMQRSQKKLKLQRKIQKIRQMLSSQKENILKIEQKATQKQQARLSRKRVDRQAYEYACYIKNKWQ